MFHNTEFANPELFWLFLLIPALVAWYIWKYRDNYSKMTISGLSHFKGAPVTLRQRFIHLPFVLKILVLSLLIVALTRPQSSSEREDVSIEGIDIIMAIDISSSMLAQDLQPNRLEASKKVAIDFAKGRPNDRMGLVIFSGEAFTQCPLTTDHQVLEHLFTEARSGMIEDGTAIGDGLATAISRLKDSQAISKVIILITDGVSNMGALDASSAAEIAKLYGIRVYTIGVGTMGTAPYPVQTPFGVQMQQVEVKIDELLLQQVADMTDGKYYRATSNKKLQEIYQDIDTLEKSKIDVTVFSKKSEEFHRWVLAAALLFLLMIVLKYTWLKTLP
jgi:Ca-activated chloride channel family protein